MGDGGRLPYIRANNHSDDRRWDDDASYSQSCDDERSPGYLEVVVSGDGEGAAAFDWLSVS